MEPMGLKHMCTLSLDLPSGTLFLCSSLQQNSKALLGSDDTAFLLPSSSIRPGGASPLHPRHLSIPSWGLGDRLLPGPPDSLSS